MSKKIKINTDLIGQIGKTSASLMENKRKVEFSTENNISFSFTLDKSLQLFIKELVLMKITAKVENYHYNESMAFREGIEIMRQNFPVEQRPEEIGNPTKKGRRTTAAEGSVKVSTSFLISESDREFIYNFIYEKQKGGGRFTKEEFFTLIVGQLEKKYNLKYQQS